MKKTVFLGVALFIIFAARPFWSLAQGIDHSGFQETEECYTCHSNTELTAEHEGKTISLFVDKEKYEASVHGGM
ncbi:MAG: hypothetical protein PHT78_06725, partial [Desulfitobacteriaceae bacterium]|nr:hypothetical protein [Desulfitobacteriaceae bacterium]